MKKQLNTVYLFILKTKNESFAHELHLEVDEFLLLGMLNFYSTSPVYVIIDNYTV